MTAQTDTNPEPVPALETPEAPALEAPATESEKDWKVEAEKWKEMSRRTESANAKALKELEQLRIAQMSESEKAIAEAEKRGRDMALVEMRGDIARAKLQAQAAGKVADVDALIELVDISKLITESGVDDGAIAAVIERFTKVAPLQPAPPKFGAVELGPQGDRPRQFGEADLARMTPEQKVEARRNGQLDELMGVTS